MQEVKYIILESNNTKELTIVSFWLKMHFIIQITVEVPNKILFV
jgi:hypothetical protein